jgi:hypothetical protein
LLLPLLLLLLLVLLLLLLLYLRLRGWWQGRSSADMPCFRRAAPHLLRTCAHTPGTPRAPGHGA